MPLVIVHFVDFNRCRSIYLSPNSNAHLAFATSANITAVSRLSSAPGCALSRATGQALGARASLPVFFDKAVRKALLASLSGAPYGQGHWSVSARKIPSMGMSAAYCGLALT